MEWNNLYVIIVIALILAIIIGLMYVVPKLFTGSDDATTDELTADGHSSTISATVLMPLILQYHSKTELKRVEVWQKKYPPNTQNYALSTESNDDPWKFEAAADQPAIIVENDTFLVFPDDSPACSLMSNLPLPLTKPFIYFEATMIELTQMVALGLSTKPYPSWRLPGWHHHSVAYHSSTGCVYTSNPKHPKAYGPGFEKNDVIGVGYLSQSNTVFFTKNGRNLGRAITGFKFPIYPSIGAIGKTKIMVNFGQQAFRYDSANVWQGGLVNNEDLPLPPPTYGTHLRDTLLFDQPSPAHVSLSVSPHDDNDDHTAPSVPSPPPTYPI
ncbi:concanavalin A-like lectin/glucanase domain-containing protein [Absidia repens]|uniref:Concanavalin A-like lectin/glucanase domain-containing protein n=1 Tax=Absidia repens TaxID=90262 RepID=A0A1X2IP14_9FUNG|nr:concanavalin A-like lectin/glucanase domain-containing protein [Absidia repens]